MDAITPSYMDVLGAVGVNRSAWDDPHPIKTIEVLLLGVTPHPGLVGFP